MQTRALKLVGLLVAVGTLCVGEAAAQGFSLPPLLMETDAFEDGGIVPLKYAMRGENVQPGFTFSNAPEGTVAYTIAYNSFFPI